MDDFTGILAKLVGGTFIAVVMYLLGAIAVVGAAMVIQSQVKAYDLPWILPVQHQLYISRDWNVWQADPDCVTFDPELIYKPRIGACRFTNQEFDTVVTFGQHGRLSPTSSDVETPGRIAVVGDSFAMGWGVNDEQSFPALLESMLNERVYNLSVASYGTVRELIYLEQSGLLDQIETIIIQYCANDLGENRSYGEVDSSEAMRQFNRLVDPTAANQQTSSQSFVLGLVSYAVTYPFYRIKQRMLWRHDYMDFEIHRAPLVRAIRDSNVPRSKRIIVIYTNPWGERFKRYPKDTEPTLPNLEFVELALNRSHHFTLDGHTNADGHRAIAMQLLDIVR